MWSGEENFICRGCGLPDGDGGDGLLLPVRDETINLCIGLLGKLVADNCNKFFGQGLPNREGRSVACLKGESRSRSHSSSSSLGGVNPMLCKYRER